MSVHSVMLDVGAVDTYPEAPQIVLPFTPSQMRIANESAENPAWVSFDGVTNAAHLPGGAVWICIQRVTRVWVKRDGEPESAVYIQVTAET